jgi:hypothetical protein
MNRLSAFGRFWWDFVVGEDRRVAAGIVLAVGVSALVSGSRVPTWWVLPVAVAGVLASSIRSAIRSDRSG